MFYRSAAVRFCSPSAALSLEAGKTQLPGSRRNTRHVMATSPPLRMAGVFLYVKSILVHAWLMQETIGLYITYSLLFKKKRKHFNIGNQIQILKMSSPDHISDYRIFLIPSDFQPAAVMANRNVHSCYGRN